MRISTKFNLVLSAAFLLGLLLSAGVSYSFSLANARREVQHNAELMMEMALAVRGYTDTEIKPLLASEMDIAFHPHIVPSWAAQTVFKGIGAKFPEYAYKEVALNPTNPNDLATDWQAQIIHRFEADRDLKSYALERDTARGKSLVVTRPLRLTALGCLECHSTPDVAPVTMVDLYGTQRGFGWKQGDVIAMQVVSVPMRVAVDYAQQMFILFASGLTGVFLIVLVVLNALLQTTVLRPIRQISDMAVKVSLGSVQVPEFRSKRRDEISALGESFNRMRRSLAKALKLLEG